MAVDTTVMRTRAASIDVSGVFGVSNSTSPPLPHGGIGCIRAASGASYRASASFPRDFSEKLRCGFRKAHHIPSEARGNSPSSKGMTADCTLSLCSVFVSAAAPSVFVAWSRLFRLCADVARVHVVLLCARALAVGPMSEPASGSGRGGPEHQPIPPTQLSNTSTTASAAHLRGAHSTNDAPNDGPHPAATPQSITRVHE